MSGINFNDTDHRAVCSAILNINGTVTPGGTTGNQEINKPCGVVNFAALASSLTVTNSLVNTSSIVIATVLTNDGSLEYVKAVPGSGSFQLLANTPATGETKVGFLVVNVI